MPSGSDEEAAAEALLGSWVREKYRLDRILGIGGMAVVFAATHRNKKRVAVKMLHRTFSGHADMQRRFLREGYVANTVDHAGAVSVLDDDVTDDGTAFLVMELLEGAPVDALLERHGGRLPLSAVLGIGFQLLDALGAAHEKGIVHRDIKPANIFLTRSGQLKVLDFGIARLRDPGSSDKTTQAGAAFGTPAFMGPEQGLGKTNAIDARSDLWAVGATMFTMFTGRAVHEGASAQHTMVLAATTTAPPLTSVAPNVPAPFAEIVDRALAFEPDARFQSAFEMRDAIAIAYGELFPEAMRRLALVDLLPPPVVEPEITGGSMIPPKPRPSKPDAGEAFASTVVRPEAVAVTSPPLTASSLAQPKRSSTFIVVLGGVAVALAALGVGLRARSAAETSSQPVPSARTAAALAPVEPPPILTAAPRAVAIAPPPTGLPTTTASLVVAPRPTASARSAASARPAVPRATSQGPANFDTQ